MDLLTAMLAAKLRGNPVVVDTASYLEVDGSGPALDLFGNDETKVVKGFLNAKAFSSSTAARCITLPVQPGKTYTISKDASAGSKWTVALFDVAPTASGDTGTRTITATEEDGRKFNTFTVADTGEHYVTVYYFNSTADSGTTEDAIRGTIYLIEGSDHLTYEEATALRGNNNNNENGNIKSKYE